MTFMYCEIVISGRNGIFSVTRVSGTEPLLRVMIEGPEQHQIAEQAERVASAVREHLGA